MSQLYKAVSKTGTEVYLSIKPNSEQVIIQAKFTDVNDFSGIHVHSSVNNAPGPIIAWLANSIEWDRGIFQNTPATNFPCCREGNYLCTLSAPCGTPYMENLSNKERTYSVYKEFNCTNCPWVNDGTFLILHGKNFQQIIGCELTNQKPGIDAVEVIPFTKI